MAFYLFQQLSFLYNMEEIRNLNEQFQKLLKQTEEEMFDYVDSKILQKPQELLTFKGHSAINLTQRLELCYLTIMRKATEQVLKLFHFEVKNRKQVLKIYKRYENLCDAAFKDGTDLYIRMQKKLATSCEPEMFMDAPYKPFAMGLEF